MKQDGLIQRLKEQLKEEDTEQKVEQIRLQRQILFEKLKLEQPDFREYLKLTDDLEMFEELPAWLESSERGLEILVGLGLLNFPEQDVTSKYTSSGKIVTDEDEA
jgi:hypothetical protein